MTHEEELQTEFEKATQEIRPVEPYSTNEKPYNWSAIVDYEMIRADWLSKRALTNEQIK